MFSFIPGGLYVYLNSRVNPRGTFSMCQVDFINYSDIYKVLFVKQIHVLSNTFCSKSTSGFEQGIHMVYFRACVFQNQFWKMSSTRFYCDGWQVRCQCTTSWADMLRTCNVLWDVHVLVVSMCYFSPTCVNWTLLTNWQPSGEKGRAH